MAQLAVLLPAACATAPAPYTPLANRAAKGGNDLLDATARR